MTDGGRGIFDLRQIAIDDSFDTIPTHYHYNCLPLDQLLKVVVVENSPDLAGCNLSQDPIHNLAQCCKLQAGSACPLSKCLGWVLEFPPWTPLSTGKPTFLIWQICSPQIPQVVWVTTMRYERSRLKGLTGWNIRTRNPKCFGVGENPNVETYYSRQQVTAWSRIFCEDQFCFMLAWLATDNQVPSVKLDVRTTHLYFNKNLYCASQCEELLSELITQILVVLHLLISLKFWSWTLNYEVGWSDYMHLRSFKSIIKILSSSPENYNLPHPYPHP